MASLSLNMRTGSRSREQQNTYPALSLLEPTKLLLRSNSFAGDLFLKVTLGGLTPLRELEHDARQQRKKP